MKKIPLTQNQYAIVDDENYDFLNRWKWHAVRDGNTFYAVRKSKTINGKRKTIRMHRVIMNPPNNMDIDHINHNGLDNQKVNLRVVTNQQNQMNRRLYRNTSSFFKGVSRNKLNKLWQASIEYNGKSINLGYFEEEIDACIIYNQKAIELFGEYAHLNPIPDKYKNRVPIKYKAKTSSRFTGVTWDKINKRWKAYIKKNKKQYHLGYFLDEEAAHQAYLKAKNNFLHTI